MVSSILKLLVFIIVKNVGIKGAEMFIKLTNLDGVGKLRVNTESIVSYEKDTDSSTYVDLGHSTAEVKETPEQIDQLLIESHIFIKEIKETVI